MNKYILSTWLNSSQAPLESPGLRSTHQYPQRPGRNHKRVLWSRIRWDHQSSPLWDDHLTLVPQRDGFANPRPVLAPDEDGTLLIQPITMTLLTQFFSRCVCQIIGFIHTGGASQKEHLGLYLGGKLSPVCFEGWTYILFFLDMSGPGYLNKGLVVREFGS